MDDARLKSEGVAHTEESVDDLMVRTLLQRLLQLRRD